MKFTGTEKLQNNKTTTTTKKPHKNPQRHDMKFCTGPTQSTQGG